MKKFILLIILLSVGVLGFKSLTPEDRQITAIQSTLESVVRVDVYGNDNILNTELRESHGTGFYVAPNLILTAAHVTQRPGITKIQVVRYGEWGNDPVVCSVKRGYVDDGKDLILLKVDCEGKPLQLNTDVHTGQDVYMIGSPNDLDWIVTKGIVSNIYNRSSKEIQADINADHGNSGSPMIDRNGKVIALADAINKDNPYLAFGIHAETIKYFLKSAGL